MFYMGDKFPVQASKAYVTHTMADKFIIQFILSPKLQFYKLGIAYSEKYLWNHYIPKVLSFCFKKNTVIVLKALRI